MRLKDLGIKWKLNGGFIIPTIFIIIVGMTGIHGATRVMGELTNVSNNSLPGVMALADINVTLARIILAERSSFLAEAPEEVAWQQNRMLKLFEGVEKSIKQYDALPHSSEEAQYWNETKTAWDKWKTSHDRVMELLTQGDSVSKREAYLYSKTVVRKNALAIDPNLAKCTELSQKLAIESANRAKDSATSTRNLSIIGIIIGAFFAQFLGVILSRSILIPLKKGVTFAEALKNGDLTHKIAVDQQDELGDLANSLNGMSEKLRGILRTLVEDASKLNNSASEFSMVSEQLLENSSKMSERSNTVAAAAEEMSANMTSVSAAAEQSEANTNAVATATEEMTASVGEIAQNSDKARKVTSEAVASVDSASNQMNELGSAAQAISQVIEVIVEIAEQTKLLALNATIEAARAGEAGKGFAVVASEVKDLAKQTNDATELIRQKIEAMQHSTNRTISEIDGINQVMHSVEELIASIASAVEEQSITTQDIANNINQAAQGISSVTQNVTQTADVARDVAKDITSVNQASSEVRAASNQVSANATELARMSKSITAIVEQFKV